MLLNRLNIYHSFFRKRENLGGGFCLNILYFNLPARGGARGALFTAHSCNDPAPGAAKPFSFYLSIGVFVIIHLFLFGGLGGFAGSSSLFLLVCLLCKSLCHLQKIDSSFILRIASYFYTLYYYYLNMVKNTKGGKGAKSMARKSTSGSSGSAGGFLFLLLIWNI